MMMDIRSLLFVPAEDRRLAKIGCTAADGYIIDLEDSIDPAHKEEALQRTVDFLMIGTKERIFVRVNKGRYRAELEALRPFHVGIVLPKFETRDEYGDAEELLQDRAVVALVETPKGVMEAYAIAAIPWVWAIAFGAEDFCVASHMRNARDNLFVPKSLLSMAAKANGKRAYDTPCFHIRDEAVLRDEVRQAVDLGFDGKLAVHPDQIVEINRSFHLEDRAFMEHIVAAYEASDRAVCEIDGMIYERFHIDRYKALLAEQGQNCK